MTPPSNKFGGRCDRCHKWVAGLAGHLIGQNPKTGKWKIGCKECVAADASAGPTPPPRDPIFGSDGRTRRPIFGHWQHQPLACYLALGLTPPVTTDDVKRAYRKLSLKVHPDHGGDAKQFIAIKEARDRALAILGGGR